MRSTPRFTVALAAAALCAASVCHADTSPEAQVWLEKMAAAYARGPFRVDYTASMDMHAMEQTVALEMTGELTHGSERHQRMALDMKMTMPGSSAAMSMSVLAVADGEAMWIESTNPMTGTQVIKAGVEDLEKLSAGGSSGGFGLAAGGNAGLDPVGKIESLTRMFDFELRSVEDGRATLRAEITGESLAGMNVGAAADQPDELILVLNAETGFPMEMRMGGDEPILVMTFSDVEFLSEEDLGESTFHYEVEPGVSVLDLGALRGMTGEAGAR